MPRGAVVEVDGLDVGVVHRAGACRSAPRRCSRSWCRTRTGRSWRCRRGRCRPGRACRASHCLSTLPLLASTITNGRVGEPPAGVSAKKLTDVGHAGAAVVVDEDHLADLLALDEQRRGAAAEARPLADGERRGPGRSAWRVAGSSLARPPTLRPNRSAHVAVRVFADDDLLAPDRDAAEGLLVAVVAGAVRVLVRWSAPPGAIRRPGRASRRGGRGPWRGMPDAAAGLVLAVEQGNILVVQVGAGGGLGRGHGEGQGERRESEQRRANGGLNGSRFGIPGGKWIEGRKRRPNVLP